MNTLNITSFERTEAMATANIQNFLDDFMAAPPGLPAEGTTRTAAHHLMPLSAMPVVEAL